MPQKGDVLSNAPQEEPLLQVSQRRLPPEDQARLHELRQRHEAGSITDAEHQEPSSVTDCIEQQDAERVDTNNKVFN